MEEKELLSSNDEFLVTQVCAILKQNNIPFIRKDSGAGSYINVTYGKNTTLEKKIIVNSEDFEKAQQLIEVFSEGLEEDDEIPEELQEAEEDDKTERKYNKPAKIAGWMLGIFFVALIIVWIVQLVKYFIY